MNQTHLDNHAKSLPRYILSRKIRKGTWSCWQCKRRKIKCDASLDSNESCTNCKRRNKTCISQKYSATKGLGNERLCAAAKNACATKPSEGRPCSERNQKSYKFLDFSDFYPAQSTVADSVICTSGFFGCHKISRSPYLSASKELLNAWPSERELKILLTIPNTPLCLSHGVSFSSKFACQKMPSLPKYLELREGYDSSFTIARKLLLLAIFLQHLSIEYEAYFKAADLDHNRIKHSAFRIASAFSRDVESFKMSIEGIECLALSALYLNGAGSLLAAWESSQLAVSVAKSISCHGDGNSRFLMHETRMRVDAENMWFNLVQFNGYLAVILGWPQTPHERCNTQLPTPSDDQREKLMQHLEWTAASQILHRDAMNFFDVASVRSVDRILQKSACTLPAKWWNVVSPDSRLDENSLIVDVVDSLMTQLAHFHLLTHLHLPLSMTDSPDCYTCYSKLVVINSSREVLLRFISLHRSPQLAMYCRGVSLLAFVACISLSLMHYAAKHRRHSCRCLDPLINQYQTDYATMQSALGCMEITASTCADLVSRKTAPVLRAVIEIMPSIICHGTVLRSSVLDYKKGYGSGGSTNLSYGHIKVHIPFIGFIRFEQGFCQISQIITLRPDTGEADSLTKESTDQGWEGVISFPLL